VFENRVLRKIFGPKRDDVTGEWKKLHSEEVHNLYSFPDIISIFSNNTVVIRKQNIAQWGIFIH
jgi:hypothetical protein